MLALVVSLACLGLNAFFVAAEFALVKVRLPRLEARAKRGERRAMLALDVTKRLDRFLSVTQFGITLASLGLGWVAEPALERLADGIAVRLTGAPLGPAAHVAVDVVGLGLLTSVHLLVGELVPKFVAIRYAEATTIASALPLRFVDAAFRPLLFVLEKAQNAILGLLGIDPHEVVEGHAVDEAELTAMLASSGNPDERRVAARVLRLAHTPVRTLMVPRVDTVALDVTTPLAEAIDAVTREGFSRVPLVENGSLDDVVGYLYAKDLLFPRRTSVASLRDLARRVLFIPATRTGLQLLRDMQRAQCHLAVVVDEYGGTAGIITLENLVEGFVGAIRDESDVEADQVVEVKDEPQTFLVDARATADELIDRGVPLGEETSGIPIGRLVVEALGRIPKVGDVAALGSGVLAEVVAMSRRRVRRVRVHLEHVGNSPESAPS